MRKRVFGHMRTAKAQISLRIRAEGLHSPLTESLDTTECMNMEQIHFTRAQDDLNIRILHMFEGTFSLTRPIWCEIFYFYIMATQRNKRITENKGEFLIVFTLSIRTDWLVQTL